MAIHFSKEDEEKLKNSTAAIYQKRSDETNREDIKALSVKEKCRHFLGYYSKKIIVAVILLAVIVTACIQIFRPRPETGLHIVVGSSSLDKSTVQAFEKAVQNYLKYDDEKKVVKVSLEKDTQKMQTYLYSGDCDVVILDEEYFKDCAQKQFFYDMQRYKEVSFYKQYDKKLLYNSAYLTEEELMKGLEAKSSDKKYSCGLYLTESEKCRQLAGNLKKPVLGISLMSEHSKDAKAFTEFMMDNSKKMQLKTGDIY